MSMFRLLNFKAFLYEALIDRLIGNWAVRIGFADVKEEAGSHSGYLVHF